MRASEAAPPPSHPPAQLTILRYLQALGLAQLGIGDLTQSDLSAAMAGIDAGGGCDWNATGRSLWGWGAPRHLRECRTFHP